MANFRIRWSVLWAEKYLVLSINKYEQSLVRSVILNCI